MVQHRHAHDQRAHAGLRLGLGVTSDRAVHRVGRRQFLTELGRNAFAIAVVGGFVTACSDDAESDDVGRGEAGDDGPGSATDAGSSPVSRAANDSLRWAQANLGFVSAYVLVRGNEAAVVDTGQAGSADQIGEALATLGATYDDVRHVVLTHHHPDHVGSLPVVLERAGGSTAYAGEADVPNITAPAEVIAVGDGDDVFGLQVVHTPGHTPGSISLFDPGIGLLVAGDALTGDDDGSGLATASERFSADMSTANDSVLKLAELDVDAVAMGHGQPVESGAGPLLTALAADL